MVFDLYDKFNETCNEKYIKKDDLEVFFMFKEEKNESQEYYYIFVFRVGKPNTEQD